MKLCYNLGFYDRNLGDITDAKTPDLPGSNQLLEEWKEYDKILRDTMITERTVWLDTRGNHGKQMVKYWDGHPVQFASDIVQSSLIVQFKPCATCDPSLLIKYVLTKPCSGVI